jgi:flavorubredoxin
MAKKIKNNVYWMGKVDWELRRFHGEEYSTNHGTTYNSYLIREEKTVLIDTVWDPFSREFMRELPQEVELDKIDAVIINHSEVDHSGAMSDLMQNIPDVPVYCTPNGVKALKGHYHKEWNFRPVRTGDTLDIGNGKKLIFIEAAMLHWPDTMFTYLTGDNILFSNDAFGQHMATDKLFADRADQSVLWEEEIKYFANILSPTSKLVDRKIKELRKLDYPIEMICTSHGACWRSNIEEVLAKYETWANGYKENRITVLYDSMWGGTRAMAEAIAKGMRMADDQVDIIVHCLSKSDKNDVMTDIFRSKAILVGSPSHNKCLLSSVAATLEEMRGLGFAGKKAAAFGCYGWSGEAQSRLSSILSEMGFNVVDDGLKNPWEPDCDALDACIAYGKAFALKV